MWITNDLTSLSPNQNFTLQLLSKLNFQTSKTWHNISLWSSALEDLGGISKPEVWGLPTWDTRRKDVHFKEVPCLSEQPRGLHGEIRNCLVAACPKHTALPGCQQLGRKRGVPDSEVMGWARVLTTEVRDICSLLHTSVAPQTNMVMQTSCSMNQRRGGARRHLNWELGKKRKPLHLGFDEETDGWTGKRGGQAISLGEAH